MKNKQDTTNLTIHKNIVIFICAALTLLFCSKNSPLFIMNDWDDMNLFITVGNAIRQGKIPFKDFYEQKGPIAQLLFTVLSAYKPNRYLGFFILEVISAFFFLYYSNKIMYSIWNKSSIGNILLLTFLYKSVALRGGGSLEELTLGILAYVLYTFYIDKGTLKNSTLTLLGAIAAILFFTKFTLLGLQFALYIITIVQSIKDKNYKYIKNFILYNALGFLLITTPLFIWLYMNHALLDMLSGYIYNNIFAYNRVPFWAGTLYGVWTTPILFFVIAASIYLIIHLTKDIRVTFLLVVLYICAFIKYPYGYYAIPLFLIVPIALVLTEKHFNIKNIDKFDRVIAVLFICLLPVSHNQYMLTTQHMVQYDIAEEVKDTNYLVFNSLDTSIYNINNDVPNTYNLVLLNSKQEETAIEYAQHILNEDYDFIITDNQTNEFMSQFPQYKLYKQYDFYREASTNYNDVYYLYKRVI